MQNTEIKEKIEEKFFVVQITGFELGVANSHNLEQDNLPSAVNV